MPESLVHTYVDHCMTRDVLTVGPYDSLAAAWELMSTHHIRRLPVVHDGKLAGIVTQRDVLNAKPGDPARRMPLAEVAEALDRLTVGATMTRDPVSVFENDTVGHAAELMLEHKIGGLPVVDSQHRVVGLITESNVFRLLAERWRNDNLIFSGAH